MKHRRPFTRLSLIGLLAAGASLLDAGSASAGEGIQVQGHAIPDNAAVRERDKAAVYQVVNGGKLWITSPAELAALGYSAREIRLVPSGSLASVPNVPKSGTLVRQRSDHAVYQIENGVRHWVSSPKALELLGRTFSEVRVVSNTSLNPIPQGARIVAEDFEKAGQAYRSGGAAHTAARGYNYKGTDAVHLESGDGKVRLVGGISWYNGYPKFWVRRGEVIRNTKAYAPGPVECIWVQVKFGYPLASLSFPPAASLSGAEEVGEFYRSCRRGSQPIPAPIDLSGLGYVKAGLNSATFTVCTSRNAAEGPRNCGARKHGYA